MTAHEARDGTGLAEVRRTLSDIVSLSKLSAVWIGADLEKIAESLADTLADTLMLTWCCVRIPRASKPAIFICRSRTESCEVERAKVESRMRELLDSPGIGSQEEVLVDHASGRRIHTVVTRCGEAKNAATLITGAIRSDYPNEHEHLLLELAASQAAIAISGRTAEDERAKLVEQAQLLAAIVASSNDAIISKTLDGVITSWNRAAESLFGYRSEEIVGRPVTILIPHERLREEDMILGKIRSNQSVEHYETVRKRRDGSLVHVSVSVSPVLDDTGRVIGASKIARDISEHRRAETERAQLLAHEREARNEAEVLNDVAHRLGESLEIDGLIRRVTDAGMALTGAEFAAFLSSPAGVAGAQHSLFCPSVAARSAFDGLGVDSPLMAATFRDGGIVRSPDVASDERRSPELEKSDDSAAEPLLRSYLAVPITSRTGDVIGGLFFGHSSVDMFGERVERRVRGLAAQAAVCFDNARLFQSVQEQLTERRLAEDRERAARTEAERAIRMRDEFLASVSHELRTPLHALLGWSEVLRRSMNDPEMRSQAYEAIERSVRSQTRLVEDLLDMSRAISGKLRLDVQAVDIARVIDDAIATTRSAADAKGIVIETHLDRMVGPIRGDAGRLQQVFWNLLSNAVKFTPSAGRILIHLERTRNHVEIVVSDTGCGIDPQFLPFIFDRFRQGDSTTTRKYGGLGLGLAIVKQLVEMHGGTVSARSDGPNRGATFGVRLPLPIALPYAGGFGRPTAGAAAPTEPAAAQQDAGAAEFDLTGVSVLMVDDDDDSCVVLRRVLEDSGARVDTVNSAPAALALLNARAFDLLVSDIGMPGMDGYQLIGLARSGGLRVPAIALTAFARPDDRIRSIRAGFDMHLSKPVEPRELVAIVDSLTRSRHGASRD